MPERITEEGDWQLEQQVDQVISRMELESGRIDTAASDAYRAMLKVARAITRDELPVADYSSVPNGPGVMLIAYHAHYSLDATEWPSKKRNYLIGEIVARLDIIDPTSW